MFSWNGKRVWLSKSVQGPESWRGVKGAFPGLEDTSGRVRGRRIDRSCCSLENVGVKATLKTKWVQRVREKGDEGMSCQETRVMVTPLTSAGNI